MVAKGGVGGEDKNWEFGVSRYRTLYIERINIKVLLHCRELYSLSCGTPT